MNPPTPEEFEKNMSNLIKQILVNANTTMETMAKQKVPLVAFDFFAVFAIEMAKTQAPPGSSYAYGMHMVGYKLLTEVKPIYEKYLNEYGFP